MFHSVTLYKMLSVTSSRLLFGSHWQHCIQSNTVKHKDLLEVTDNIAYRVTLWNIKICWKSLTTLHTELQCCQWLPADLYVSQRYSVWNIVSDFQQIIMFHSVTLYAMLSVTSNRSLCFTVLLCMQCGQCRVTLWNMAICWKSLTTLHTE
jgi:hypothetical protein